MSECFGKSADIEPDYVYEEETEMNNDLSKVKVGDWIWTIKEGWQKVLRVTENRVILEKIDSHPTYYRLDGKYIDTDKYPSAFRKPPSGFNAEPKPCEFKKGDRVLVSDDNKFWKRAYYSFSRYDLHYCFSQGDEWMSADNDVIGWKYCKKPEEVED